MIDQKEAQAIVDGIAPGITVAIHTTQEPTYTLDGGKRTARLDEHGEHIRHPVTSLHLTLGRVTCSFDLLVGSGSPHEREPRTRSEIDALIRTQVGNLLTEAVRKPPTVGEHRAWQAEQSRAAAERAAVARAARAAEDRAAMSDAERAAADYLAEHGEPDYFTAGDHLEQHAEHLAAAVGVGAMTTEQATAERERIAAWKQRCEQRREETGR